MHRLLFFVLVVATAAVAPAAAQAYQVFPISTDACTGFAETYPADYLYSGNLDLGFMPPGAYVAPGNDQGAISPGRLGGPNGTRWVIHVSGLIAPGEAPNFSIDLPTLTAFAGYSYTISGTFTTQPHEPSLFISGSGPMQIVRSDGARMWGQGNITLVPAGGGEWEFGAPTEHCTLG
jgi:hypothetical protein